MALHNLLFLVRKLISNKLVEAFDWLSCRKKACFSRVLCRVKAKKANKNMKQKNLSSFITSLPLSTMLSGRNFCLFNGVTKKIKKEDSSRELVVLCRKPREMNEVDLMRINKSFFNKEVIVV